MTFQVGLDTGKNLTEATELGFEDFHIEPYKNPAAWETTANSSSVFQHEMLGTVGEEAWSVLFSKTPLYC